tara:strand:+ start:162 stop:809 length:648 start_codon:yes stop_codon:yes gene_type:complete
MTISVDTTIEYPVLCFQGMGLDPHLLTIILTCLKSGQIKRVLEFGSGSSTQFLLSMREKFNLDYSIDSFDHDEEHCFKAQKDYEKFELKIRKLIQYSDSEFSQILQGNDIPPGIEVPVESYGKFRMKNVFYDVKDTDLTGHYDLVILDGPNGNGRSVCFNHISKHLKKGSVIVIDDYHHHPYMQHCQKLINTRMVRVVNFFDFHPLHGYAILEVV